MRFAFPVFTALLGAAAASGVALAGTVATIVTCAASSACVRGANTAGGPGVEGTGITGDGVDGTSAKRFGVQGVATGAHGIGVAGEGTGTATGTYGGSSGGPGVRGASTNGPGVSGTSTNNNGVFGATSGSGNGVSGFAPSGIGVAGESMVSAGVFGLGDGSQATGVVGTSQSGFGVQGESQYGIGVQAQTADGLGIEVLASAGGGGLDANAQDNFAVLGINDSPSTAAVDGRNDGAGYGGFFWGQYGGVWGETPPAGYPIVATDEAPNTVFYVTGTGDVYLAGTLTSAARTTRGTAARAYGAKTTSPTVEDTGTAELIAGTGTVRLDPTFAETLDPNAAYRVFITPGGDTRGLYVAAKTATAFVVRENQGGRSTVAFDYRIVGTALGERARRMAPMAASDVPRLRRATFPAPRRAALPRPPAFPPR